MNSIVETKEHFNNRIDTPLLAIDKDGNIIDLQPNTVTLGENIVFFNNHPKVATLRSLILSGLRNK